MDVFVAYFIKVVMLYVCTSRNVVMVLYCSLCDVIDIGFPLSEADGMLRNSRRLVLDCWNLCVLSLRVGSSEPDDQRTIQVALRKESRSRETNEQGGRRQRCASRSVKINQKRLRPRALAQFCRGAVSS